MGIKDCLVYGCATVGWIFALGLFITLMCLSVSMDNLRTKLDEIHDHTKSEEQAHTDFKLKCFRCFYQTADLKKYPEFDFDKNCFDNPNATFHKECEPGEYCGLRYYALDNGHIFLERACQVKSAVNRMSLELNEFACTFNDSISGMKEFMCSCNGNLCLGVSLPSIFK